MDKVITHSDLRANNKVFRLQSTIQSRIDYFTKNATWALKNKDYPRVVHKKFNEIINDMYVLLKRAKSVGFMYNTIKSVDKGEFERLDKEYLDIYREVSGWPKKKEHFENLLFLIEPFVIEEELSNHILGKMATSAKEAAISRTANRLFIQMNECLRDNWYMIFSTLTVNGEHYEKVFEKGSDLWRNYIRSVKRHVGKTCSDSFRMAEKDVDEYFHFFAVVEEGGETERLHMHVMMFMKDHDFTDPNYGRKTPEHREIKELEKYWPWGMNSHIAIRFNSHDAWATKGSEGVSWKWPVEWNSITRDYQPIDGTTPLKMKRYLLKYITKAINIQVKGDTTSWKTRSNHTMGKTTLTKIINRMQTKELMGLTAFKMYPSPIKMYGQTIQGKLIRYLAVKELLNRIQTQEQLLDLLLEKNIALKTLVKNMNQKKRNRNWQNIGDLLQKIYRNEDISKHYLGDFINAKAIIENACPAPTHLTLGTHNFLNK